MKKGQEQSKDSIIKNFQQQIKQLQLNQKDYENNYEFNRNCFNLRVTFYNCLELLWIFRQRLTNVDKEVQKNPQSNLFINPDDLPSIKLDDDSLKIGRQFLQMLKKRANEKGQIKYSDAVKCLFSVNKDRVIYCCTSYIFQNIGRICFSIVLYNLFVSISSFNYAMAYGLAALAGILLCISGICRHNGFQEACLLNNRFRSILIFTIYESILTHSQYTIRKAQLGKINNMLANDFNNLELKIPMMLSLFSLPFTIIGIILILAIMIDPRANIAIVIVLIFVPIQYCIGKMNGKILTDINVHKDDRVKNTTEAIQGIKFIKLYGWQIAFIKIIQKLRHNQIVGYMKMAVGRALQRSISNSSAFIAGFAAIILIHYTEGSDLTIQKIFSILQIMAFLKIQIFFGSIGFGFIFQFSVVLERFANIYNIKDVKMIRIDPYTRKPIDEQKQNHNSTTQVNKTNEDILQQKQINFQIIIRGKSQIFDQLDLQAGDIILQSFDAYWIANNVQEPTLRDINQKFHKGKLYGIGGQVGSGKSAFLGCLLQEVPFYSGNLQMKGSISFVQQQPVIFSCSIKDNIVFGRAFNQDLYQRSIKYSCLLPDLNLFQNGDQTNVGQKGTTLSGGQRARLSFARALYGDSDIYLLDDPLSAVDAKVAKQLFYEAIKGILKQKTVILVTHQVHYLEACDELLIFDYGAILCRDKPQNLAQQINQLLSVLKEDQVKEQKQQEVDNDEQSPKREQSVFLKIQQEDKVRKQSIGETSKKSKIRQDGNGSESSEHTINHKVSTTRGESKSEVTTKSYFRYVFFNSFNYFLFPFTVIFFISSQIIITFYVRFLANYNSQINVGSNKRNFTDINNFWLTLGLLQLGYFLNLSLKYFLMNVTILKSNQAIHNKMIQSTIRSPTSYFDLTPSGQLINRFSTDLGIIDNNLIYMFNDCLEMFFQILIMAINIIQINIYFLIVAVANVIVISLFFIYCKRATLAAKQMDLMSKAPLFNSLNQMASGLVSLTIYNQKVNNIKKFCKRINNTFKSNFCFWLLSRIFGVFLTYMSSSFVTLGLVLGVIIVSASQQNGLYAVSAIFLCQGNDLIQWFLRQLLTIQSLMISTQRSYNITKLPSQAQLYTEYDKSNNIGPKTVSNQDNNQSQKLKTDKWPLVPSLTVKNFSMRYRSELPLVLRQLSFKIQPSEKVGIVGRTGAGKSSIIQALFRISEPDKNSIYQIDGKDAKKVGLHTLRQNMSVIPQTPFIFRGSIRQNLDPFGIQSQQDLWDALYQSGLSQYIDQLPNKMQTDASSSSEIFSVGQKQLLCLARALLRKSKILFLDEATSNVDLRTDDFIQKVLKQKFAETTVITIAHRLNTIADYDKLIVMKKGKVKEIGSPYELILKKGLFYNMVSKTGKNMDSIIQAAKQSHLKKNRR